MEQSASHELLTSYSTPIMHTIMEIISQLYDLGGLRTISTCLPTKTARLLNHQIKGVTEESNMPVFKESTYYSLYFENKICPKNPNLLNATLNISWTSSYMYYVIHAFIRHRNPLKTSWESSSFRPETTIKQIKQKCSRIYLYLYFEVYVDNPSKTK